MAKTFTAQLENIAGLIEKDLQNILRQSAQDVGNIAQTPAAQGGPMPVDTGFSSQQLRQRNKRLASRKRARCACLGNRANGTGRYAKDGLEQGVCKAQKLRASERAQLPR